MSNEELLEISKLLRGAVSDPDDMVFLLWKTIFSFCPWERTYPGHEKDFARFINACELILREKKYDY
jgi:hypothetical protein